MVKYNDIDYIVMHLRKIFIFICPRLQSKSYLDCKNILNISFVFQLLIVEKIEMSNDLNRKKKNFVHSRFTARNRSMRDYGENL